MSFKLLVSSILSLMFLVAPSLANEKIYTWVDDKGVTHFSHALPPQGQAYTIKEIKVNKKKSFSRTEPSNQTKELERIAKENCEIAKKNITILNSFANITQENADGTSQSLTPEDKKAQLELARKQVELFCYQSRTNEKP